jgi:1-aminocyclopropane-1-carboxylate synthase
MIFTPFGDVDQFAPEGVAQYETALLEAQKSGTRIRAMMLCNPHNPLGRCYPKETLIAIMRFCQKYKIHLLCDEIYALSVYDVPEDPRAIKFTSVLSFDSSTYINSDYLHVLYGMSKDEAAGGLRLGCLYTQNSELMDAMSAITQFHVRFSSHSQQGWVDLSSGPAGPAK